MPCYHPKTAYQHKTWRNSRGKAPLTFKAPVDADMYRRIKVNCGYCVGCRLEYSRRWAMRIIHETQMHESNVFLTLTYRPESIPMCESINHKDYQDFLKRLRYHKGKCRYFVCGEYGEENERPHYHMILFGMDFEDKKFYRYRGGNNLYVSEELNKIWSHGNCIIGDVSWESAAYVARYILKKVNGEKALEVKEMLEDGTAILHYDIVDSETGLVLVERMPEFTNMSNRPGIARDWFEAHHRGVYASDSVVLPNGIRCKPARYYDKLFDVYYPERSSELKAKREELASKSKDNTPERLAAREEFTIRRLSQKSRKLEKGEVYE